MHLVKDQPHVAQLDFAGVQPAISTQWGFIRIQDLVMLGLPYPEAVDNMRHAMAAWVHSAQILR